MYREEEASKTNQAGDDFGDKWDNSIKDPAYTKAREAWKKFIRGELTAADLEKYFREDEIREEMF